MSTIEVESLLQEISPDEPGGDDLEYDPVFQEMERAAQGKPEQQMGDSIIPAEDPDWKELKRKATEVLGRSKDLRAAVYVSRALVYTDGYQGLADGLALLQGLVSQFWDTMHPQLDPDDDNDPIMRINALESLSDRDATLRGLRAAPLVAHRVLGRFGLREIEIASGEAQLPSNWEGDPPSTASIEAAFMDVELEELTATAEAINLALERLAALEAALGEKVAATSSANLSDLQAMLQAAKRALAEPLASRGVAGDGEEEEAAGEGEVAAGGARISGEVSSREDVLRVLDRVCEFYRRSEPSSPVPILLQRAKRLVAMDFLEAVRNLAPGGVSDVELIRGPEDD